MTENLSAFFALGCTGEALLLIFAARQTSHFYRRLGAICFLALIVSGPWFAAPLAVRLLLAGLVFALFSLLFFKKEILPQIGESNLLISSLVFWYLMANLHSSSLPEMLLTGAAIAPTILTVAVAFLIRTWSFRIKLFCYLWFLGVSTAIIFFSLHFVDLLFFFDGNVSSPGEVNLFFTGMCLTHLVACLIYLEVLMPRVRIRKSKKSAWETDVELMAGHFADYQMRPTEVFVTLAAVGLPLALNYWFGLLAVSLLSSLMVVFAPRLFRIIFHGWQPWQYLLKNLARAQATLK
jgi:hypothetical protein